MWTLGGAASRPIRPLTANFLERTLWVYASAASKVATSGGETK